MHAIQIRKEVVMSGFDSPVGRCEAVCEMVLLDETQQECAHEHECPEGRKCPLAGQFAERSGVSSTTALPPLGEEAARD